MKETIIKNQDKFSSAFFKLYNNDELYTSGGCSPADAWLHELSTLGQNEVVLTCIHWMEMSEMERVEDAQSYLNAVEWDKNRRLEWLEKDEGGSADEYQPADVQEMAKEITRAIEIAVDEISDLPF